MMQKLKSLNGSTLTQHAIGLGLALLVNCLEIQMLIKACSSSSRVKVQSKLEKAQSKMQLFGSKLEKREYAKTLDNCCWHILRNSKL